MSGGGSALDRPSPARETQQADVKKLASQCFVRAGEALRQGQHEYAIQLYRRCCDYMPDALMFRQSLREAVKQKLGDRPARRPFRRLWVAGRIRGARWRKESAQPIIDACEQALSYNPWNKSALLEQARAFVRLGYDELAIWDLESLLELDPEHPKAARELAALYEQQGAYEKAARLWTLLRQQDPTDDEARQRWRALQHDIAEELGQSPDDSPARAQGDRLEELILPRRDEQAPKEDRKADESVEEQSATLEDLLERARRYQGSGDFDNARRILHRALQTSGGDLRALEQCEDLEADVLRRRVVQARHLERSCPERDGVELQKRARALQIELNDYELDLYRKRVDRYPRRLDLKYEFGTRLIQAGLLDEAILQLTEALKDPQLRLRSSMALGECFTAQGDLQQATQCYEQALRTPSAWDDPRLLDEARRRLTELSRG